MRLVHCNLHLDLQLKLPKSELLWASSKCDRKLPLNWRLASSDNDYSGCMCSRDWPQFDIDDAIFHLSSSSQTNSLLISFIIIVVVFVWVGFIGCQLLFMLIIIIFSFGQFTRPFGMRIVTPSWSRISSLPLECDRCKWIINETTSLRRTIRMRQL